jgi:hypothetical protein
MAKLKKLPADCTFPQLAVVLEEARFIASLQAGLGPAFDGNTIRGIKVKRIYYKPGRSCRVTFEAKIRTASGAKGEQFYYGKIVAEPKPASLFRRAQQAHLVQPRFGPAVALLADLGMVVWAYPNDPNLPGLALLADRDAVVATVQRDPAAFGLPAGGALVELRSGVGKYVPGQRCGYRYRGIWRTSAGDTPVMFYGKAYQPGLGRGAYDIMMQLMATDAARDGRLRLPRPHAFDAGFDVVWQEMLPGESFAKEANALDLEAWAGPVAAALAAFHASRLDLGPGLGLSQELEELAASSAKIERAYPQYATRVAALRQRLQAAVPSLPAVPAGPVHGSFKISHVFDVGGRVAFIDFDGAGIGDPTYDVGRFLAHLAVAGLNSKTDAETIGRAVERFRTSYSAGVPWGWQAVRVHWYTAALLLSSQAYKCVKRMAPERVGAILGAAEAWFPEH